LDFAIVAERERTCRRLRRFANPAYCGAVRPQWQLPPRLTGMPMMFGHGTGSELRRPLGYSAVGRLALSQISRLQAWVQPDGPGAADR
jgi:hydrophobic/amphiphilic exporter-1 (mainly G- bacteria), HAE1 family